MDHASFFSEATLTEIGVYIHASIDYKKQGSAVLITIRCEEKLIECCF